MDTHIYTQTSLSPLVYCGALCAKALSVLSRPDHLNSHVRQVHSTERPFKCPVTSKPPLSYSFSLSRCRLCKFWTFSTHSYLAFFFFFKIACLTLNTLPSSWCSSFYYPPAFPIFIPSSTTLFTKWPEHMTKQYVSQMACLTSGQTFKQCYCSISVLTYLKHICCNM